MKDHIIDLNHIMFTLISKPRSTDLKDLRSNPLRNLYLRAKNPKTKTLETKDQKGNQFITRGGELLIMFMHITNIPFTTIMMACIMVMIFMTHLSIIHIMHITVDLNKLTHLHVNIKRLEESLTCINIKVRDSAVMDADLTLFLELTQFPELD